MNSTLASQIVESLRRGLPPQRGTRNFAVGHEKLISGIQRFQLDGIADRGLIRFVCGSWGAGKTHFFRLMRELAFENECLVSTVELNVDEAPLNKFERVFQSILRNVSTPRQFSGEAASVAAPFGIVLREAISFLSSGSHSQDKEITAEDVSTARGKLMICAGIDLDFKKIIALYWLTFLPDAADPGLLEQRREELLQWFSGEGTVVHWRKQHGINKVISKDNSKLMLESLAAFVHLVGYKGLLILFDEAEMSYSIMRKSALKEAHNNLLHLIGNVSQMRGIFLIYATTPDFYSDPKHGIVIYGALASRIGMPPDYPPKALETVWNLDAIQFTLEDYQVVAGRILAIYNTAYPGVQGHLPTEAGLNNFVKELNKKHAPLSQAKFWRVLTPAVIRKLDSAMEGEELTPTRAYRDVMSVLRDS